MPSTRTTTSQREDRAAHRQARRRQARQQRLILGAVVLGVLLVSAGAYVAINQVRHAREVAALTAQQVSQKKQKPHPRAPAPRSTLRSLSM